MKPALFLTVSGGLLLAGCTPTATAPDSYVYRCESGARVIARYPDTDSAQVTYLDRTHQMSIDVSASGARYVGNLLEWWTKGPKGTLLQRNTPSDSDVLEQCQR